jgi:hypothetical protein
MRDERIANVYVMGNGHVCVVDVQGQQMPEYQGRLEDVQVRLEAAYPRRLWHAWSGPGLCQCGRRLFEHTEGVKLALAEATGVGLNPPMDTAR